MKIGLGNQAPGARNKALATCRAAYQVPFVYAMDSGPVTTSATARAVGPTTELLMVKPL